MTIAKVEGYRVTLTDDDGAVYKFEVTTIYPNSIDVSPALFRVATIRSKGKIDIHYMLPETIISDTMRTLELREHTSEKWFITMVNTIIGSLG